MLLAEFVKAHRTVSDHPLIEHYSHIVERFMNEYILQRYEYIDCGGTKIVWCDPKKTNVLKISYEFPSELTYLPYRIPHIIYPGFVKCYDPDNDIWISRYPYVTPVELSENELWQIKQVWKRYGIYDDDGSWWNYGLYHNIPVCFDIDLEFI